MIPKFIAVLAALAALVPTASTAVAQASDNCSSAGLTYRRSGPVLLLEGSICQGDDHRFLSHFQALSERSEIRVVQLNSDGGNVRAARNIGLMIRAAGLATLVDASQSHCFSACTMIFAGGVRRHYVGATSILEGDRPPVGRFRYGLGYHMVRTGTVEYTPEQRDAAYRREMLPYFLAIYPAEAAEKALDLARNNRDGGVFVINAQTAVQCGIATSDKLP